MSVPRVSWRQALREAREALRRELAVYRCVGRDPRTPRAAKWLIGLSVAYLLLPFDLIPDWIPVIGQVDDLIIVPAPVILAVRMVPEAVVRECRARAAGGGRNDAPARR